MSNKTDTRDHFILEYQKRFPGTPRVFRAPGRINLIGEHTDYNMGFVFPVLLDRYVTVAVAPRDDQQLHIWSEAMDETRTFTLGDFKKSSSWSDYVVGIARELARDNIFPSGANVCIFSDIPMGGGLSSSAAIEVAVASGLLSLTDTRLTQLEIALICQRTENDFIGMPCGIMDQFVITHGQENHALLLDCRSLEYEHIALPVEDIRIIVCNTGIKHELSATAYNRRTVECQEGVVLIKEKYPDINSLRDVSMEQLMNMNSLMPDVIRKRCRHVFSENERVINMANDLKRHELSQLGGILYASHDSLCNDYEVSCKELDIMVDIARRLPGVLGARMTGGGFGGCTVNFVEAEYAEDFSIKMSQQYKQATGIDAEIFAAYASDGMHELE